MSGETLRFEIGAILEQSVEEIRHGGEVFVLRQVLDRGGESEAIDVAIGSEGSGAADLEDAVWIFLGFEERESGFALLFAGEWGFGIG